VYATLKGILDSDSAVTVTVRPFTAIRSATNPDIEGSVLLDGEFPLIAADDVGAVNMAPINFLVTGALAHVTSAT
jgi:hypothetical protein